MVDEPVTVGLAGAGPWARLVHAPTLAAGPETTLAAVWSRTPAHARTLADEHDAPAVDSFDALVERCEAVVLAVPPAVQPGLAVRAAAAGRTVLLEKPLAVDVRDATRVAEAVATAGVGSLVGLTYRFRPSTRAFLAELEGFDALGGRGCFLSGAFLGGPFAGEGWRRRHGCVLDVGPHVLDLLDAALGPVVEVAAVGDPQAWVSATLRHESGAVSEAAMCCRAAIDSRTEIEVVGDGERRLDARAGDRDDAFAVLRADLADVARTGRAHECDVGRGVHVQLLVAAVHDALASGRRERVPSTASPHATSP